MFSFANPFLSLINFQQALVLERKYYEHKNMMIRIEVTTHISKEVIKKGLKMENSA